MNVKFSEYKNGVRAGLYFTLFIAAFIIFSYFLGLIAGAVSVKGSAGYSAVVSLSAPFALSFIYLFAKFIFDEDTKSVFLGASFSRAFTGLSVVLTFGMLFGLGFINDAFVKLLALLGIPRKA